MRRLLGVLLAGALVLGACGGDSGDGGPDPSDDPQGALIEALEDLAENDGNSIRMSVASDEESLNAVFEADEASSEVPEGAAETILNSSFTFSATNAEDPADAVAEIIFELDGEEAAAMLVDGYDLYAHADVPYIMETFGQDPAVLDEATQDVPPSFDFVDDFLANEWIHLSGLEQFAEQAEASGQMQSAPNLSAQQQQLIDNLTQSLEANSEVSEGDEDGPGTHLQAKVDLQAVVEDFEQVFSQLGQLSGVPLEDSQESLGEIPPGDLIVDTWVEDGTLTQMDFDILANVESFGESSEVPEGVEEFAIRFEFDEFDGDVETPDDAVEVSFQDILSGMMSGAFQGSEGVGGSPGSQADPCEEIAALPEEQQEPFKDICPDL